jgi:hypothetical protein
VNQEQAQAQEEKKNQQRARSGWKYELPRERLEDFIKTGTTTNDIQKKPFAFPVTVVALSDCKQFAVYWQAEAGALEIPLCLFHETAITYPIRLFLATSASPEFLLQAKINARGDCPSDYHFTP